MGIYLGGGYPVLPLLFPGRPTGLGSSLRPSLDSSLATNRLLPAGRPVRV